MSKPTRTSIFAEAERRASDDRDPDTVACGPGTGHESLGRDVLSFLDAYKAHRDLDSKLESLRKPLLTHFEAQWFERQLQGSPPTPLRLRHTSGDEVVYVTQDRTASRPLSDDQVDAITAVLGDDAAAESIEYTVAYGFDPDVMAKTVLVDDGGRKRRKRRVEDLVGEALDHIRHVLVANGSLTAEEASRLVRADRRHTLRRGFLSDLPSLCKCEASRMSQALKAVGSSIVRFIRVGIDK